MSNFLIWTRVDHRKLSKKRYLPLLLEDPLISKTCPLEESASHHMKRCEKRFLPQLLEDPLISETCPLDESASYHLLEHVEVHEELVRLVQRGDDDEHAEE